LSIFRRLKSKTQVFGGEDQSYLPGKKLGKAILNLVAMGFKIHFPIGPKRVPFTFWPDDGVDYAPENLCLTPYCKQITVEKSK